MASGPAAEEGGIAEAEDAAVVGHQPAALAVRRGHHGHDRVGASIARTPPNNGGLSCSAPKNNVARQLIDRPDRPRRRRPKAVLAIRPL